MRKEDYVRPRLRQMERSKRFGVYFIFNVLMIEGSLLFSVAATRRTEHSPDSISYPFTFGSVGSGSGALALSDDETSRGEMWMPLWSGAASLRELERLFSEGRITVGRRAALDGLDVARAIATYGVDRGISGFERYAFAQRNGLAFLATSLGRLDVRRDAEGDLIADLERRDWLDSVRRFARRAEAPGSLKRDVRRLENAIFEVARKGGKRAFQEVVVAIGALHRSMAFSLKTREKVNPVPRMPSRWLDAVDDGSDEVMLATAFASLGGYRWPLCTQLFPLAVGHPERLQWDSGSNEYLPGGARLIDLLASVARRRGMHIAAGNADETTFSGARGVSLGLLDRFFSAEVDEDRVLDLMLGLSLVESSRRNAPVAPVASPRMAPAALLLMKAFFIDAWRTRRLGPPDASRAAVEGQMQHPLALMKRIPEIIDLIAGSKVDDAIEIAAGAVRRAGGLNLPRGLLRLPMSSLDRRERARRLLAALIVPIDPGAQESVVSFFQSDDPSRRVAEQQSEEALS